MSFCVLCSVFCILCSVVYVVSLMYMNFRAHTLQWPSLPYWQDYCGVGEGGCVSGMGGGNSVLGWQETIARRHCVQGLFPGWYLRQAGETPLPTHLRLTLCQHHQPQPQPLRAPHGPDLTSTSINTSTSTASCLNLIISCTSDSPLDTRGLCLSVHHSTYLLVYGENSVNKPFFILLFASLIYSRICLFFPPVI